MATMADVAKRAGVSLSTASYALSGKRPISNATRSRVLAAMQELGFHPNNQGRALASGRSRTLALLYPVEDSLLLPMPMEFVTAASIQAERRGYALILSTTGHSTEHVLSLLHRGFVDGYLVMEVALTDPRVDLLMQKQVPFALIGRRADNTGLHFIDLDFEHAIELAMTHLISLGHRSIGLLCRFDGDLHEYGPTVRMSNRFRHVADNYGICGTVATCPASPGAGDDALNAVLASQPNLTALVCSNTESITGILRSAAELGRKIPDDLSLVGIISPRLAEFLTPPITAVDFPAAEMGRRGVDLLIDQLEGSVDAPQQLVLRSSVTVRGSTSRVPG
ncbi:MAG: LacI family DNA-binding transcriptional regulator [Thermomicrobiales bacterium]